MPDEKYDSGHPVINVLHGGTGETHAISVDPSTPLDSLHKALVDADYAVKDTPLPEFHDALLDSGYAGGMSRNWAPYRDPKVDPISGRPRPNYGPTKEGVLENSPEFKKSASEVWTATGYGKQPTESGTYLDENGERGPIVTSKTEGKMSLVVPKEAQSTIHSHPDHFNGIQAGGQPSDTDIETAKKLGKSVYVVSKSGLQVVEKDGKVTNVFSNPDWMSRDNK